MDIIQLQDKQVEWRIHRFMDTASQGAVLATHDIHLGKGVTIADYVMLGDHCVIGDNVHLSEESVVSHHCRIGEGTLLDTGAFVSMRSQLGSNCSLAADSFVGPDSTVGNGCSIGRSSELGDKVHLGNNISTGQGSYIMDKTIRFNQLATFTSLEGIRCIRAQIGGVWLPSKRVEMADSYAFSEGKMSLRDMADKYIVPDYIRNSIAQNEIRAAGMRR